MLTLYSWPTANGRKVHIMLEETGISYRLVPIDIYAGQQHEAGFNRINPNRKIPALVIDDEQSASSSQIFESGAILVYLAECSRTLLPAEGAARYDVLKWLMFQMSAVGPTFGQAFYWNRYAETKVRPALERYVKEAKRIYRVLDAQLANNKYLAGDAYSIADIAVYPWLESHKQQGIDLTEYPALIEWRAQVSARPAVRRGMALMGDRYHSGSLSADQRHAIFRD